MASEFEKRERLLLAGAAMMFFLGMFGVVVLPSFDKQVITPTKTAQMKNYLPHSAESRGRAIYVREGCIWCHSQAVRPVAADSHLGPVSVPGDYYYDNPVLIMTQRSGPDLTWVGQRYSPEWQQQHLKNPQSFYKDTIMPRYDYLSQSDRNDLVTYLMSLKPAPAQ